MFNKIVPELLAVFRYFSSKMIQLPGALILTGFLLSGCNDAKQPAAGQSSPPQKFSTASGLIYEVVSPGSGPQAKTGDTAMIHEITTLGDGTVVTDTWTMNFPISFLLGGKQVIDGLDEAVTGMRVGERRKLIVPPSLSKRSSYPENGLFGPSDTLYYDVILLKVSPQQ